MIMDQHITRDASVIPLEPDAKCRRCSQLFHNTPGGITNGCTGKDGEYAPHEWHSHTATLTARVAELEQENAKLLDEVEARRFTDERTDKLLDELEAEVARLQATLDGDPNQTETPETRLLWRQSAIRTADRLEAENKRLKEALEEIQGYGEVEVNPQHDWDVGNDLNAFVRIAREALANKAEIANKAEKAASPGTTSR